jgi:hypothetical protein
MVRQSMRGLGEASHRMRLRTGLICTVAGLALVGAWACGSSSKSSATADGGGEGADGTAGSEVSDAGLAADAPSSDAAPIPLANLCPLFTEDLCIYLIQCDEEPYRDMAHCLAENTCYGLPQLMEAASQGAVLYNPSVVGACNASFRADPCNFGFFLTTPDIFEVLAFCPGAVTPELEAGDPCLSSGECQSGLFCNKNGDQCPGTCTAYATAGQTCTGTGFIAPDAAIISCGPSLICNSKDVCQPYGSVGSACSRNGDCGPSILCFGDGGCPEAQNLWCDSTTNKCAAGVGVGQACGVTDAGSDTTCAPNLWCEPSLANLNTGSCAAVGGVGAPCDGSGSPIDGCQNGLHCVGYNPPQSLGQCEGPASAGSPCTATSDCASGLVCASGSRNVETCTAVSALGGTCTENTECQAGLTCVSGQCADAGYPGTPCEPGSVCVLSVCKNGMCVDHANVGQACSANSDCTTNACIGGTCADRSVCANPGDVGPTDGGPG